MGMFDSFYVEVDGRELELQSKRFECGLGHYRPGDFVAGCLPGVRVFFETLFLDGNGKPIYGAEREAGLQKTVFIALVEGVFVEHQVHADDLCTEAVLAILGQLRERWSDSARWSGDWAGSSRSSPRRGACGRVKRWTIDST